LPALKRNSEREAGARIRTADLLITNAMRATSEVRENSGRVSCDQALHAAPPFRRLRQTVAFFDRQV